MRTGKEGRTARPMPEGRIRTGDLRIKLGMPARMEGHSNRGGMSARVICLYHLYGCYLARSPRGPGTNVRTQRSHLGF